MLFDLQNNKVNSNYQLVFLKKIRCLFVIFMYVWSTLIVFCFERATVFRKSFSDLVFTNIFKIIFFVWVKCSCIWMSLFHWSFESRDYIVSDISDESWLHQICSELSSDWLVQIKCRQIWKTAQFSCTHLHASSVLVIYALCLNARTRWSDLVITRPVFWYFRTFWTIFWIISTWFWNNLRNVILIFIRLDPEQICMSSGTSLCCV